MPRAGSKSLFSIYGAMRIVGPGIWDGPADRAEVLRTLRALPELRVDFIDTADSYGPNISEDLIREALHPYTDMVIATRRASRNRWAMALKRHPVSAGCGLSVTSSRY